MNTTVVEEAVGIPPTTLSNPAHTKPTRSSAIKQPPLSAIEPALGPLPHQLRVLEDIELAPSEGLFQKSDNAMIEWIRSRSAREIINEVNSANDPRKWSEADGYRFYFMTFRFKSIAGAARCLQFYDTYVNRSISKQCGYSRKPITFIREYEYGLLHTTGRTDIKRSPHHIHATVGIPAVEHVIRRFERYIGNPGRCGDKVTVDWRPLGSADEDIERAYWYMRKRKTRAAMGGGLSQT